MIEHGTAASIPNMRLSTCVARRARGDYRHVSRGGDDAPLPMLQSVGRCTHRSAEVEATRLRALPPRDRRHAGRVRRHRERDETEESVRRVDATAVWRPFRRCNDGACSPPFSRESERTDRSSLAAPCDRDGCLGCFSGRGRIARRCCRSTSNRTHGRTTAGSSTRAGTSRYSVDYACDTSRVPLKRILASRVSSRSRSSGFLARARRGSLATVRVDAGLTSTS